MIDIASLKPSVTIRPPKCIIYGTSKIGKSTFASQAPHPVALDLENGMESINIAKHKVNTFQQALEFLRALYSQEHSFKNLIVDSIDWLERIMIEQICRENGVKTLNEKSLKYGNGERMLVGMWKQFIRGLDFLHHEKNMGIILIAHPQIKRFDDPLTESYDQYSIKLEKKSGDLLKEWVDCILFATLKVKIEEEKVEFGGVINRGKDLGRILYTERRPSFEAGNRYKLPPEMDLNWETFSKHINKYNENLTKVLEQDLQPKVETKESEIKNDTNLISELQANFIKRLVTPERLIQILRDHKLTKMEEMNLKDYHALTDKLRLEKNTNEQQENKVA